MSQIFEYFKSLFHPSLNQDRKRRRIDAAPAGPQVSKYRRVTNVFPEKYHHKIDDEVDHFQQVKRNQQNYNEILENFLMDQQRKQFRAINDEEFSDEEDLSSVVPVSSAHNRRPNPNLQPSTSGFNFSSESRQSKSSVPQTFNFQPNNSRKETNAGNMMSWRSQKPDQKPPMPELVPIKAKVHSQQISNGFAYNGLPKSSRRSSLFNFEKKNRAFNDSPKFKFGSSVLDRNQNMNSKRDFNDLLKSLIPRFSQKASQKVDQQATSHVENITTVDLSSDETDTSVAGAVGGKPLCSDMFESLYRNSAGLKHMTVVLSDDDDDDPKFNRESLLSSTCIRKKSVDVSSPNSSQKKSEASSFVVPQVTPVNSLRDRQQNLNCLHDDAIISIVRRFEQKRQQDDKNIRDNEQAISKLTRETAAQEKLQQTRIDETLSSLTQCVILDEDDDVTDDYPPLTEQQLRVIHFGLHGHRGEVIISKFNVNITRTDLITLDGLNWLNDGVINFYMELIKLRSEEVDYLPKVHVMNTFFIGKLLQQGHSGVKRWTRKVDIFKCDIIPVPVHVGGVHWCMSVIHMVNKTIRYYDSMGHPNQSVLNALTLYLKEESMDKRKVPFDMSDWSFECVRDCPQQRNGSDCGVFSCMFAEFLSRDAKITFDQEHMQYFRRKMVYEIATGKLILGY